MSDETDAIQDEAAYQRIKAIPEPNRSIADGKFLDWYERNYFIDEDEFDCPIHGKCGGYDECPRC